MDKERWKKRNHERWRAAAKVEALLARAFSATLHFVRKEEDAEVAARRIPIRITGRTGE
jgi:hypothetical protein